MSVITFDETRVAISQDAQHFSQQWAEWGPRRPYVVVQDTGVPTELVASILGTPEHVYRPSASGESLKTWEQVEALVRFLEKVNLPRSGAIVGVGGGALTDLTGFVASIWMRGVDYVMLPTTWLGMVDACLGGKTGVNLPSGKNRIGTFHFPREVFLYLPFCAALPQREWASGMAEVIKAAVLTDRALFQELLLHPMPRYDAQRIPALAEKAVRLKYQILDGDLYETNPQSARKTLNLGHTFGHAIEALTNYSVYKHGEAVAIGMRLAAEVARQKGWMTAEECHQIAQVLQQHGLPTCLEEPLPAQALLSLMLQDKKNSGGRLHLVLPHGLGKGASFVEAPLTVAQLEDLLAGLEVHAV